MIGCDGGSNTADDPGNTSAIGGGSSGTEGAGGADDDDSIDGASCTDGQQCNSGFCVDGVCCESACANTCGSCNAEDAEGTCTPYAVGHDPDAECPITACGGGFACAADPNWAISLGTNAGFAHVAVDGDGNTVVAGEFVSEIELGGTTSVSEGGADLFVAKYAPNGDLMWAKVFGDPSSQDSGEVQIDAAGNIVFVGFDHGRTDFGGGIPGTFRQVFVVKLDENGAFEWSQHFATGIFDTNNMKLAVSGSGDIIVGGPQDGAIDFGAGPVTPNQKGIFAMRLDATGQLQWVDAQAHTGGLFLVDLAVADRDEVFGVGSFTGTKDFGTGPVTAEFHDGFLVKWSADGDVALLKTQEGAGAQGTQGVSTDSQGNVFIGGSTNGPLDVGGTIVQSGSENNDGFIAKLDASGDTLWARNIGTGDTFRAQIVSVHADSSDHVLVALWCTPEIDLGAGAFDCDNDVALGKLSGDGAFLWQRAFSASVDGDVQSTAIGANDEIAIAGFFAGVLDIGATEMVSSDRSLFVARLAP